MSASESETAADDDDGGIEIVTSPAVWFATVVRFAAVAGIFWLVFRSANLALGAGAVALLLPMVVQVVGGDHFASR